MTITDSKSSHVQVFEDLLTISDPEEQRRCLAENIYFLDEQSQDLLAKALKKEADHQWRADIQKCLQLAKLIDEMSYQTGNELFHALSLRVLGNAYALGLGEYQQGIEYYDEAARIYEKNNHLIEQAQSQIGKIWALANLGCSEEAIITGDWARKILREFEQWLPLGTLISNMAILHGRLSNDLRALELLEEAQSIYEQLGHSGEVPLQRVNLNRAIILRNLGRFNESIKVNEEALEKYQKLERVESAARAQQNLGMTYFVLGRNNEALALLEKAKIKFLTDDRQRHAMLVELFTSNCLLQLRRFPEVLDKCVEVRTLFGKLGANFEVGQAILNEATAYIGLKRYNEALSSLAEARTIFEKEKNQIAIADADVQIAAVLLLQGRYHDSLALTETVINVFQQSNYPIGLASAQVMAARAALALNNFGQAATYVNHVLDIGTENNLPSLAYQGYHLKGLLEVKQGKKIEGLAAFEHAVQELERLSGNLMLEFRANFIEDKSLIYEDIVSLCLDLGKFSQGLEFSERAKSRTLQDLVTRRIDLNLEARSQGDQALIDELKQLRSERDRLYRRWETAEEPGQRGETNELYSAQQRVGQVVLDLEKRITKLWHTLLVRNADYARDVNMWQVRTEPIQPHLESDTILVEYFFAHNELIIFLVTKGNINAYQLPVNLAQISHYMQLLWLNLKVVPQSSIERLSLLKRNIQGVLHKLFHILLAPLVDKLYPFKKLIIVPHGTLHYLPFHALYDGQRYLLEHFEISYLPGASLLKHCQETISTGEGLFAIGHSLDGRLPYTLQETKSIVELWQGKALFEDDATLETVNHFASHCRIFHLAAHGDFRPDNPLFSGLALADGWLTTLDIFNLRLQASLVTLSACQTGRSVIGGGDELLGLMRAFLGAGAASLVSSFWAVEDKSTADLMLAFYQGLKDGISKGAALRRAQLQFLQEPEHERRYGHPYFWAPFFLVGDSGTL